MSKNTLWIKEVKKRGPIHIVVLVNLILFSLLALRYEPFDKMPLIIGGSNVLVMYLTYWIFKYNKMGDPYIASMVSMLATLGLVMQYRLSPALGTRHFKWFLLGNLVYVLVSMGYPYVHKRFRGFWFFYGLIIAFLLLTQIFGVSINGAKNWIRIGTYTFQPSEPIKIFFAMAMASYFADPHLIKLKSPWVRYDRFALMFLVYVVIGMFVLQVELGSALMLFLVYISMMYVFSRHLSFIIGNVLLTTGLGVLAVSLFSHVQVRITAWLNPFSDIAGRGYQITQGLFAIGSGGFFGTGLGLGHPLFIPNVATDFVFAAICEEMGIFGGFALLLLFFLMVYRGIKISMRLYDPFTKALAFGLAVTIGYQAFVIIGGIIRVVPLTGITLPFISYGGSSLLVSYIAFGMLQALSGPILKQEVMASEAIHRS